MSIQVKSDLDLVHPILVSSIHKIQKEVIEAHNAPFKLFETGRGHQRHQHLLSKGRTQDIFSKHLYNLENNPPMYAAAIDYVFYDGKWSWNLRNKTVKAWYELFGNIVLDVCPELIWGGSNRKSTNYNYFELRQEVILDNFETYPCILHP